MLAAPTAARLACRLASTHLDLLLRVECDSRFGVQEQVSAHYHHRHRHHHLHHEVIHRNDCHLKFTKKFLIVRNFSKLFNYRLTSGVRGGPIPGFRPAFRPAGTPGPFNFGLKPKFPADLLSSWNLCRPAFGTLRALNSSLPAPKFGGVHRIPPPRLSAWSLPSDSSPERFLATSTKNIFLPRWKSFRHFAIPDGDR